MFLRRFMLLPKRLTHSYRANSHAQSLSPIIFIEYAVKQRWLLCKFVDMVFLPFMCHWFLCSVRINASITSGYSIFSNYSFVIVMILKTLIKTFSCINTYPVLITFRTFRSTMSARFVFPLLLWIAILCLLDRLYWMPFPKYALKTGRLRQLFVSSLLINCGTTIILPIV